MFKYIIKRLLMIIPMLLGVSVIVFAIVKLTPGNPAINILGTQATQEEIAELNHALGYDRPFLVQYFDYMFNLIIRQDFGKSLYSKLPVGTEVMSKLPLSMLISFFGILGSVLIGVPLGVLSAVKQYSAIDTVSILLAIFLAAMPVFWFGMILILIFALKLGALPTSGLGSWKHLILPSLALAIPHAAQELRYTRSSMLDTIRQDYIRTARAKGAPQRIIVWKHALGNALLPVITITGMLFSGLIGGAVLIESLFNLPGVGSYLVTSAQLKDIPAVMGSALVLCAVYSILMLVIDLFYAVVDPRVKAKYASGGKRA